MSAHCLSFWSLALLCGQPSLHLVFLLLQLHTKLLAALLILWCRGNFVASHLIEDNSDSFPLSLDATVTTSGQETSVKDALLKKHPLVNHQSHLQLFLHMPWISLLERTVHFISRCIWYIMCCSDLLLLLGGWPLLLWILQDLLLLLPVDLLLWIRI